MKKSASSAYTIVDATNKRVDFHPKLGQMLVDAPQALPMNEAESFLKDIEIALAAS